MLQFVAGVAADEVFAATALLIVLASSFATEQAGLSLELGAFVAGLMVADTEYRHQVAADIGPIRGLLLGFFFMTVGMAVDVGIAAPAPGHDRADRGSGSSCSRASCSPRWLEGSASPRACPPSSAPFWPRAASSPSSCSVSRPRPT